MREPCRKPIGKLMMEPLANCDTIPKLIVRNYRNWGSRTAMCLKKYGIWQRYSWREYYERVKYLSLGLLSLGFRPGDKACIIGDNEPEWFWGEFAVQAAGGIASGIFVDSTPSEVRYIAADTGARLAIVNDQEQTDKFLEIKDDLPDLAHIIYWNPKGLKNYDDPRLVSFSQVIRRGREYEAAAPGVFEENVARQTGNDTAFIYYTAGTVDLPKGAVFTYSALINSAARFLLYYPLGDGDDLMSNFPAAWVGDSLLATLPHLLSGARMNFPEKPETAFEDSRETGPTLVTYGPRQWEGLVSSIRSKMIYASSLRKRVYDHFMPVGHKITDADLQGTNLGLGSRLAHRAGYALLFRPLKDRLGLSRVRFAVTGGAVLNPDAMKLIHAIGIELRQNYVSTEAGFISAHRHGEVKLESIGRPARGVEVRISGRGELLVRSDALFSGYHNRPGKTGKALDGGWYHTGDAVNIDEDGQLVFLDRLDHMGVLKTGETYAPQYIESQLRFGDYIKNAMAIGGKDRAFVAAILNVDPVMAMRWAEHHRISYTTFAELSQRDELAELVRADLVRVNAYLPETARVGRFVILHKEFDPDEAEMTRTRKLRRAFIEERYRDLIKTIYNDGSEINVEVPVTYRDGRSGTLATTIRIRDVAPAAVAAE